MSQGGQQQQSDSSLSALWIVVGLVIVLGVIWYLYHAYIIWVFLQVKLFELSVISVFTSRVDQTIKIVSALNPAYVTWTQAHYVAQEVGQYVRFPVAVILLLIAFFIYKGASAGSYRQTYDMNSLAKTEKQIWPQIKPVVDSDLVDTPLTKGPWAMSMTPMDFVKNKKLIVEEVIPPSPGELRRTVKIIARLERGKANALFTMQLGSFWRNYQSLPAHTRALFAVFAATANNDRDTADKLLRQIDNNFDNKKNTSDFKGADALCAKYISSKPVQAVLNEHHYELTVMASMLLMARSDGVFATSDFLWLKPVDRRLWFMLNAVGRDTPVPEAAGIFSHWLAEKALGKPIVTPMIEEATNALEQALTEIVYKRDT